MRSKIVAGNWKMNNDNKETKNLVKGIRKSIKRLSLDNTRVIVAPTFVNLITAVKRAKKLERIRDDNLIAILQALKINNWGAGETLGRYEQAQFDAAAQREKDAPDEDLSKPLLTLERAVPPDWTDFNNHMNESRYLQCFADASNALLNRIGVDSDYVANSGSYFTVETHIRHLDEVAALQPIKVTTQVLHGAGKKMHLFHRLFHGDGRLLATAEQLLIHVNLSTRSASEPSPRVSELLQAISAGHAALGTPEGCGRAIGDPP